VGVNEIKKQKESKNESPHLGRGNPAWAPGTSGNPAGRPKKGDTFAEIARELLAANEIDITYTTLDKDGKPKETRCYLKTTKNFHHAIIQAMTKKAMQGDANAAQFIYNRVDGMPRQSIGISMTPEDLQAAINFGGVPQPPSEETNQSSNPVGPQPPAPETPTQQAGTDLNNAYGV
jgi:hypothetical protein